MSPTSTKLSKMLPLILPILFCLELEHPRAQAEGSAWLAVHKGLAMASLKKSLADGDFTRFTVKELVEIIRRGPDPYRQPSPDPLKRDLQREIGERIATAVKEIVKLWDPLGQGGLRGWLENGDGDGAARHSWGGWNLGKETASQLGDLLSQPDSSLRQNYEHARAAVADAQLQPVRDALATRPKLYFPSTEQIEAIAAGKLPRADCVAGRRGALLLVAPEADRWLAETDARLNQLVEKLVDWGLDQLKEEAKKLDEPLPGPSRQQMEDQLRKSLGRFVDNRQLAAEDWRGVKEYVYGVFPSIETQIGPRAAACFYERVKAAADSWERKVIAGEWPIPPEFGLLLSQMLAKGGQSRLQTTLGALDVAGRASEYATRLLLAELGGGDNAPAKLSANAALRSDLAAAAKTEVCRPSWDGLLWTIREHLEQAVKKARNDLAEKEASNPIYCHQSFLLGVWRPVESCLNSPDLPEAINVAWLRGEASLWAKAPPTEAAILEETWEMWRKKVKDLIRAGQEALRLQERMADDEIDKARKAPPSDIDLVKWIGRVTTTVEELWQKDAALGVYPQVLFLRACDKSILFERTKMLINGKITELRTGVQRARAINLLIEKAARERVHTPPSNQQESSAALVDQLAARLRAILDELGDKDPNLTPDERAKVPAAVQAALRTALGDLVAELQIAIAKDVIPAYQKKHQAAVENHETVDQNRVDAWERDCTTEVHDQWLRHGRQDLVRAHAELHERTTNYISAKFKEMAAKDREDQSGTGPTAGSRGIGTDADVRPAPPTPPAPPRPKVEPAWGSPLSWWKWILAGLALLVALVLLRLLRPRQTITRIEPEPPNPVDEAVRALREQVGDDQRLGAMLTILGTIIRAHGAHSEAVLAPLADATAANSVL